MAEIRLVGTAHVSQKSVEEVRSAIEEFQPDIVGVELDRGRFISLTEETAEPSVTEILKSGNFGQILLQWILTYIQQRIGAETGVKPGSEMLAAIEEAHQKPVAYRPRYPDHALPILGSDGDPGEDQAHMGAPLLACERRYAGD